MQIQSMKLASLITVTAIMTGCGGDSDNESVMPADTAKPYVAVTLDASSNSQYTYYNLLEGETVSSGDEWHIAFRRYNVKLGDGVEGAIGDEQADYYSGGSPVANAFTNATAELEEQSLYDVLSADSLLFESSEMQPYISSSDWYSYNFMTHTLSAKNQNYWMLKSAEGNSYAKMHVSSITGNVATFDFFTQSSSETAYSATVDASFTVSLTASGNTCFDFDSNAVVDCASSTVWDIQIQVNGYTYTTLLNGINSGTGAAAAYGPIDQAELDTYAGSADLVAQAYGTDQPGGVFTSYTWQEYAVTGEAGDHGIWPNYRVYVIDTDTSDDSNDLIKMQIINYYNDSGASGHITFRYMSLTDDGL